MRILLSALLLLCVLLGLLEVAPLTKSLVTSAWAGYLALLAAWYCLLHELSLGVHGDASDSNCATGTVLITRRARCRPLLTKCCTSVVGFAIGDVLAQYLGGMRCVLRLLLMMPLLLLVSHVSAVFLSKGQTDLSGSEEECSLLQR